MPHATILIVDDEPHILDAVEYVLGQQGYQVSRADSGAAALAAFDRICPDLVVLDLLLPDIHGRELLKEMRGRNARIPVIILSSLDNPYDRVVGLEMGADDYVTKPFEPRELAARVGAVLRRSHAPPTGPVTAFTHGPLTLDTEALVVRCRTQVIELTHAECRLLEALLRFPARVFTRDGLIDRIYDREHVVTPRSVDASVKRLRRKFQDAGTNLDPIRTVHGVGYRLNHTIVEGGGL